VRAAAPRVAADLRPDREPPTEIPPPPPAGRESAPSVRRAQEEAGQELLDRCGIDDLDGLAVRCAQARRAIGRSSTRCSPACLLPAITLAVRHRGQPADQVERALLAVAADPPTASPMRVAEAGPWWDLQPDTVARSADDGGLARLESLLEETDGLPVGLQAQARTELAAEGQPVVRATVARRACH
jgi:hypothetical protein